MTGKEHKSICAFLIDHRLNQQELFEEFYDHIVSSYEDRPDKAENIHSHLETVLKDLGGKKGMRKILIARHQAYGRVYSKRLKELFWSFFRWPMALYSLLILGTIYLLTLIFPTQQLFTWLMLLISLAPITIGGFFALKFNRKCRKEGKIYRSRVSHSAALKPALLLTFPIHIWNLSVTMFGSDVALTLNQNMALTTVFTVLLITFTLTCLRLMTEANTEKLTTS
ncbi:MAG: hypothetical protein HEP71_24295 [Roseivirga sp.]|nr:hypothetical protein [Roseivirga sp.]